MKRCEYVFVRLGQGAKAPVWVLKVWKVPNFDFGILEEGGSVGIVKEWVVDVVEVAAVRRLIMKCGRWKAYGILVWYWWRVRPRDDVRPRDSVL